MEGKYLTSDVHTIILAYLPVISLIRFKSVCKSWKTIIEDHGFIDTHRLIQATKRNDNCVLIRNYQTFCLLHSSETGVVKCVDLDLPVFKDKDVQKMKLAAPCNGILCMSDGEQDIALWNPAIRQFKLLPRPLTPTLDQVPPNESLGLRNFCLGFGFDRQTDDYKVVRIQTFDYEFVYRPRIVTADMYSLNSDSWKSILSVPMISLKDFAVGEVYLDGKYYWCFEPDYDVYKILCFDMVKEVFEVLDLPDCSITDTESWDRLVVMKDFRTDDEFEVIGLPNGNHRSYWSKLMLMKDSLAMVSYIYSESQLYFHIWEMKEDGGLRSWHKFLTIGPFYDYDAPFGFWKTDELLFKLEGPYRLISYDNTTREAKGIFENFNVFDLEPVGIYNESLVLVSRVDFSCVGQHK